MYHESMNSRRAQWIIRPLNPLADKLAQELNLPQPIARVLVNRGFQEAKKAELFLKGSLKEIPSPFLFADMERSLDRIEMAIEKKEKILIFGDYDADGILALVMLYQTLRSLGAEVDYYIPDRIKEGYGVKESHLPLITARQARLVITVDCGIKSNQFVSRAQASGIDVIITDHHQPGGTIPPAYAVLNPHLPGSGYPDCHLAGVGVAFKLIQALLARKNKESLLPHYTKLVAIGTITDVVPLLGENRILVRQGLESLKEAKNLGLRHLLSVCGLQGGRITENDIGYRVGPRLNAAGRMASANLAVRLFLTEAEDEARRISELLDELNAERQTAEEKILLQALARIQEGALTEKYRVLLLGCETWHRGIIGIVAARLKEQFNRPVILFHYDSDLAYGSGRSINSFSLIQALRECEDLFEEFGGHHHAAGCVLRRERVPDLKRALNHLAASWLKEEDLRPTLIIDDSLRFGEISRTFYELYSLLPPFGPGNPRPLFLFSGVKVISKPQILTNNSAKIRLRQDGRVLEAVIWAMPDSSEAIREGALLEVVASLQPTKFWGEETFLLSVEDWCEVR